MPTAFRLKLNRRALVLMLCTTIVPIISSGGTPLTLARPGPKAVTPFTSFTFGDVYRGEVISQIFVVKNEGDSDLQILDFKASCGCEVTRSDKVIPPGKEGTATLEVQTGSLTGETSKTATLHTNDPARPAIIFTLNANVLNGSSIRRGKYIGPIFLSPDSSSALYAMPGKKATAEFLVTAEDAPVKVLRVEAVAKRFAPRVEVVEQGRSYKIVVDSIPLSIGGLYSDQLRVVTDNASLPAFTLDVALRVYAKE